MKKLMFVVGGLYAALGSVALAATGPSVAGYGGEGGTTQAGLGGVSGTPAQETVSGTLPFTGLDLGLIVAAAVLLVVLGFGLRRIGRRTPA